jgi:hypothetical protein
LTDFAFPTSEAAEQAKTQFEQTPNTLCQAPGRMALWDTASVFDCIPFYDFTTEKNTTTGFDLDYQKIVSGHTLRCKPDGTLLGQTLEPNKGPETLSPEQIRRQEEILQEQIRLDEQAQQEKNENGENTDAPPPGTGSFGGKVGSSSEEELNENGLNPAGSVPGAGSFGGICGVVPDSSTAKPGEFVDKVRPCPTAAPAPARRRHDRRQKLSQKKDYCVDRLVISHLQDHSAQEVCNMTSSWGPDFVSIPEGLHCDMCTRELSRLCSPDGDNQEGEDCFNVDKRRLKRSSAGQLEDRDEYETKSYLHVLEWK